MSEPPFVVMSHKALFEEEERRCDACGAELPEEDDDDLGGSGLYVWTRGDEVRYEEPPLCPSCATAIGLTALQRWEIEEEEG